MEPFKHLRVCLITLRNNMIITEIIWFVGAPEVWGPEASASLCLIVNTVLEITIFRHAWKTQFFTSDI